MKNGKVKLSPFESLAVNWRAFKDFVEYERRKELAKKEYEVKLRRKVILMKASLSKETKIPKLILLLFGPILVELKYLFKRILIKFYANSIRKNYINKSIKSSISIAKAYENRENTLLKIKKQYQYISLIRMRKLFFRNIVRSLTYPFRKIKKIKHKKIEKRRYKKKSKLRSLISWFLGTK